MPTIAIRVSDAEKADLESAARRSGQTLSEFVRQALAVRDGKTLDERVAALEARLDGEPS